MTLNKAKNVRITGLFIYPIKATAAISLPEADVRPRGLAGDRRWVVVDQNGQFLQQRTHARLAVVNTALEEDGGLLVSATDTAPLRVQPPAGQQRGPVTVWNDTVDAADAEDLAAFSDLLGE